MTVGQAKARFPWRRFLVAAGAAAAALVVERGDAYRRAVQSFETGDASAALSQLEDPLSAGPDAAPEVLFLAGRAHEEQLQLVPARRRFAAVQGTDTVALAARFHGARVRFFALEVSVRALLQAEPDDAGVSADSRRLHRELGQVRSELVSLLGPRSGEPKLRHSLEVVGAYRAQLEERFGLPPSGVEEGSGATPHQEEIVEGAAGGEEALAVDAARPGVVPDVLRWDGGLEEVAQRLDAVLRQSRERERARGFPAPRPGEPGW